jgi:aminomethyltransferase
MTASMVDHNSSFAPVSSELAGVRSDFQALIAEAAVYALPDRAWLSLTGSDRVRWLNGMVTNNIRDLSAGQGVYAFLLNAQGRILGDLHAFNRGDSILVETDRSQLAKLRETFDHYIIMDDVEVSDASGQIAAIGIAGPKSAQMLRSAEIEVSELAPLQLASLTWRQIEISVVRTDNASVTGFELWVSPANAEELHHALVKAGARAVSLEALELLRVACGIPRYGQDIRERDLPQETGQARALNFTKGCYVGQEIVERIRSRGNVHRIFTGFAGENAMPAVGTKILAESKEVGEITSVGLLPVAGAEKAVALGYIRREAVAKELMAGETPIRTSELPFKAVFSQSDSALQ